MSSGFEQAGLMATSEAPENVGTGQRCDLAWPVSRLLTFSWKMSESSVDGKWSAATRNQAGAPAPIYATKLSQR
jgi:hypothetical protein